MIRRLDWLNLPALAAMLAGCGGSPPVIEEIGRSRAAAVYYVHQETDAAGLAKAVYGTPQRGWLIEQANTRGRFLPGDSVIVPLSRYAVDGVTPEGLHKVQLLCYHRFIRAEEAPHPLFVTDHDFRAQLDYLIDNGYTIVPLSRLLDYSQGHSDLPARSVVLTIDDGFGSVYDVAYPILREYGVPATVFIYHDLIGGNAAMSWEQVEEMARDPLISIQSHSKTHANLNNRLPGESDDAYRARLIREIDVPLRKLSKLEPDGQFAFSFPYGEGNALVADLLSERGYRLAVTVQRGGNASFVDPFMMNRTMIYGQDSLDVFIGKLDTFEDVTP